MKILKPNKYTNIGLSVIGLGAGIIELLKNNTCQKYEQLLEKIVNKKGQSSKENFLLALCFLHSLGKVDYYPQQDIIALNLKK
jgi:hypothetical protein